VQRLLHARTDPSTGRFLHRTFPHSDEPCLSGYYDSIDPRRRIAALALTELNLASARSHTQCFFVPKKRPIVRLATQFVTNR
jgi:hypothetical protein